MLLVGDLAASVSLIQDFTRVGSLASGQCWRLLIPGEERLHHPDCQGDQPDPEEDHQQQPKSHAESHHITHSFFVSNFPEDCSIRDTNKNRFICPVLAFLAIIFQEVFCINQWYHGWVKDL